MTTEQSGVKGEKNEGTRKKASVEKSGLVMEYI
jgi:hypothetical protein